MPIAYQKSIPASIDAFHETHCNLRVFSCFLHSIQKKWDYLTIVFRKIIKSSRTPHYRGYKILVCGYITICIQAGLFGFTPQIPLFSKLLNTNFLGFCSLFPESLKLFLIVSVSTAKCVSPPFPGGKCRENANHSLNDRLAYYRITPGWLGSVPQKNPPPKAGDFHSFTGHTQ